MSFTFNPHHGLIVVAAELHDPSRSIVLRLALDTGASTTMVSVAPLVTAGYDPALAENVFRSRLRQASSSCHD